jgi:endonuclease-3 related protein
LIRPHSEVAPYPSKSILKDNSSPQVLESEMSGRLIEIYNRLVSHFGKRNWWPGDTPFEMMVGAILTQSAAWVNVEKAIGNLKAANALDPEIMAKMDIRRLRRLIKPSGYYNQKAKKLKNFLRFYTVDPIHASPVRMAKIPLDELREKLLEVNGIGKETADSILLYALDKPVFVVDAYTRRIFHRLGITPEDAGYDMLQELFHRNLPRKIRLYNDYHAQVVALGKEYCKTGPKCDLCPLNDICIKKGV